MIVVNKKIKVVIITILIVLEAASTYLMYRSFNNRNVVLDSVQLKDASTKRSGLAIMLEQEDGTYKESTSITWPEDMMYNDEKSGCIDDKGNAIDGALTYEGGVANIRTKSSSYCFLYFDLIKDDVTISLSTDGESGVMSSSGAYTNSATCSSGLITWSDKYQRIEIGNLTKPTKCNLTFTKDTSGKTLLRTEVESKSTTRTNGYRYSGRNPNNYVWFNNEMWRIIGSIPTCLTSSCGTNTTNLVKIIRNESIGGLVYDVSSSTATWGSNSLYKLLNNYYYGKKRTGSYCYGDSSSSSKAESLCDYTTIGISSTEYYGKMVKQVYWNTGDSMSEYSANETYANEIDIRNVIGYVGIMAASDYGYAASSAYHNTDLSNYNTAAITGTNWLYSYNYEWTNIRYSSSTNIALSIYTDGLIDEAMGYANVGYVVRPVVYLDSEVYIVSGIGKESDPYIIGM